MDPRDLLEEGAALHLRPVGVVTLPRATGLVLENDPRTGGQLEQERAAPDATKDHTSVGSRITTSARQPWGGANLAERGKAARVVVSGRPREASLWWGEEIREGGESEKRKDRSRNERQCKTPYVEVPA